MNIAKELYDIASAAEAKRLDAESTVAFNDIVTKARALAKDGKFVLRVDNLSTETKAKLIAAGFKVNYDSGTQYSDSYNTVEWLNVK